jgi:hypothetical protein
LEIGIWSGRGKFELFEDGRADENTFEAVTVFTSDFSEKDGVGTQILKIASTGDTSVIPAKRVLRVVFKDVDWTYQPSVFVDGKLLETERVLSEKATIEFAYNPACKYEVKVEYKTATVLEVLKKQAKEILLRAEGDNTIKDLAYGKLLDSQNVTAFVSVIRTSDLPDGVKQKLLENL